MKVNKTANECQPCSRGQEARIHGIIQAMLLLGVGEKSRHDYDLAKVISAELPDVMMPAVAGLYRILQKLKRKALLFFD